MSGKIRTPGKERAATPSPPTRTAPSPSAGGNSSRPARDRATTSETPFLDRLGSGFRSVASRAEQGLREGYDWASEVGEGAVEEGRRRLEAAEQGAGGLVERGQEAVEEAQQTAGEVAEQVVREVEALPGRAQRFGSDLQRRVEEGAEEAWEAAQEVANDAQEAHREFRREMDERVQETLEEIGEPVQDLMEDIVGPDPYAFASELEEGDSHSFAFGYTVGVAGTIRQDMSATVSRDGDGYTLSTNAMNGVGGTMTLGSSNVGGVGGDVTARGGMQLEYHFETEEELRMGMELLGRQAAESSVHCVRTMDQMESSLTDEEREFLAEHSSAVELSGDLAAGITGSLGPRLDEESKANIGGLSARASERGTGTVRLEYPDGGNGRIEVVLREEIATDGSVRGGMGAGFTGGAASSGNLGAGSASRSVRHEQRYVLPDGVTAEDLMLDPTLIRSAGTPTESLRITEQLEAGTADRTEGITQQRTYSREGELFEDGEDWRTYANLPEQVMERTMNDDVAVDEVHRTFDREGTNMAPGIRMGPVRAGVRYRNQTTHQHDPSLDREETVAERRARRGGILDG